MKSIHLLLSILFLFLLVFTGKDVYGQSNGPDYSGYDIAMQYQRNKDYVLCYKYLIIFKYTNLKRLQQPSNRDALTQLDGDIIRVEVYLHQASEAIGIKNARGFSDKQMDSVLKTSMNKIEFKKPDIN